ncbi:MAG: UTP--glucose-1-phosphate uridylyltransferase [Proteobacteria bacterium]|nr:UTP--glucose-1-phosphate uridylyltransferase [Pseudomonadota bacterium]
MNVEIPEKEVREKLSLFGQDHILRYLEIISPDEQKALLKDVSEIDFEQLLALYQSYLRSLTAPPEKKVFDAADILAPPFSTSVYSRGEDYLRRGTVGIFLVAGGQGTRLGVKGPKGCYSVSPVKQKSLFQLFAESIRALQRRYGTHFSWYIMTSRENHEDTCGFFCRNNFFGLSSDQIRFIIQHEIPSLDRDGKLILSPEKLVFKNPDGHGGSIRALRESGALEDMRQKGIEEIFYFQVDNPLAKIADPLFIGAHVEHHAEMSTKVVKKTDPSEKVGIIGKINGRLGCIEYSELTPEEIQGRKADGTLRFSSANSAIHMIRRSFVETLTSNNNFPLPYHSALKDIECLTEKEGLLVPDIVKGLKFEMFIFDALGFTKNSVTMEVSREEEFSPVKNRAGVDSPKTAQHAMINLYTRWLKESGKISQIPDGLVMEVSPLYALDAAEFREKFNPPSSLSSPLYLGP